MKNKNDLARTPPMGYNSWDSFGAGVTEEDLLKNAAFMSENLKQYGWEYVVCDIQWYEPNAHSTNYNKFADICIDEFSRPIPAPNRFPSSKNGAGFSVISKKIHDMGLKFGLHILRGIPRKAVHGNFKIARSGVFARDIASEKSFCPWNTDNYGVDVNAEGAEDYYNSLFELFSNWGVDFVKVDDIANTECFPSNPYSAKKEIEFIRRAIDASGRDMVLSLSPGPAVLEEALHLSKNANMWRMTGDFWDDWDKLKDMFRQCEKWYKFTESGSYPDCDMLPLGHLNVNSPDERYTRFTKNQQIMVMTLWSVFRSPLFFGGNLPDNDDFTNSLLTNKDILEIDQYSYENEPLVALENEKIWKCKDKDGNIVLAFFNLNEYEISLKIPENAGLSGNYRAKNLWTGEEKVTDIKEFLVNLSGISSSIFRFTEI